MYRENITYYKSGYDTQAHSAPLAAASAYAASVGQASCATDSTPLAASTALAYATSLG